MRKWKKVIAILVFGLSFIVSGMAQTNKKGRRVKLPQVGTIKNYKATGMQTGCGNLYFSFPKGDTEMTGENYVYLARGDGSQGWLNLDGRDTSLKFSRAVTNQRNGKKKQWRYFYRVGEILIEVVIEDNSRNSNDDLFFATIKLRRGHITRLIQLTGSTDC